MQKLIINKRTDVKKDIYLLNCNISRCTKTSTVYNIQYMQCVALHCTVFPGCLSILWTLCFLFLVILCKLWIKSYFLFPTFWLIWRGLHVGGHIHVLVKRVEFCFLLMFSSEAMSHS